MPTKEVTVNGSTYPVAPVEMPRSDTPQAGWFAVPAEVAKEWLKWNRSNRNIRKHLAESHEVDMDNGDWGVNGETIKLSRPLREGEVEGFPAGSVLFLDGQHRFTACIKSGKPFVTLIVWGLEPGSRDTVDAGAARNMGDVLKMNGEVLSPVLASVLRRVWMWDHGDRRLMGSRKPSRAELLKLLKSDPKGFRKAAEMGSWVRHEYRELSPSVLGTAYYLLSRVSCEQAPWFFASLKTGVGLSENHPVLTLRNRLARDRVEKRKTVVHQQIGMIIKAWNAYRADEPMPQMVQPVDAAIPDPK